MPLESNVNGIEDLNAAWPTATDPKSEGDDHLRNIKLGIQGTFPNTTGAWTTTDQITHADATVDTASATLGQAKTEITDALDAYKATLPVNSFGNVNGNTGNGTGSLDWSAVVESAGTYLITFDVPLNNWSMVTTPFEEGGELTMTYTPIGTNQARVYVRTGTVLINTSFTFMRTGL